ncbi:MAG: glycosyl transferase [Bacteroidetes bacterium]|nr:glycosyl transferase [Bacteroidota bacterium]
MTFLVVRFSSIGDIVLTTPVIRCLKQQVEGSRIIYLTKSAFEPIVKNNPFIDRYILFKESISDVRSDLANERIDFIIDLHHNLRTGILKRKLKLPALAFNKLNREKWLLTNFKIDNMPPKHIVDRYLETTYFFDVENDQKGLDYFITEEDRIDLNKEGLNNQTPYLAIVIGANHYTKQIPSDLLGTIIDEVNQPVVLLGGPDDTEKAKEIAALTSNQTTINTCGRMSINQSAYILQQAHCILTPDTGMMHIAAAFKKNIISVWGNTDPRFGMYPYMPGGQSKMFEVKGLKCRPCSKIGYNKCPKKHFKCMRDQDIKGIINGIKQLFEGAD